MNRLLSFIWCERGAVTVDWIVLTAVIVGLGVVVFAPVGTSIVNIADLTAEIITNQPNGFGR